MNGARCVRQESMVAIRLTSKPSGTFVSKQKMDDGAAGDLSANGDVGVGASGGSCRLGT